MNRSPSATAAVVRNHLDCFLRQRGIDAILEDYAPDARLYTEARIYRGKQEIHGFFESFMKSLPDEAVKRFVLRSLQVDGTVAQITWSVGDDIPLGADTFVVERGRIVSQTFAMHRGST